ncbi:MAG: pantothenate kinase type III [Bacillariaceae sp.]|jgi:pantothenate kinase type III
MFRDVPAKIFKLKNTDFFTPEQGVYPTMGVDRVAALYGAKLHYSLPALVIDGGTAMVRFLFVCLFRFFFCIPFEPDILRELR